MSTVLPVKRLLYALPSDAPSRFVRLVLGELGLPYSLTPPTGETLQDIPTLRDENAFLISYASCIAEYLDEAYGPCFLGRETVTRAQSRQVWRYVDGPLNARVTEPLVYEKVHRRLSGLGTPDSTAIQRANAAKSYYFGELAGLIEQNRWIAGPELTFADLSLAAQISLLDYLDQIDWVAFPIVADYYRRLKSRPAMRHLLHDRLEGINPSSTYADLDF